MRSSGNKSFSRKLLNIIILTTSVVLITGAIARGAYDITTFKRVMLAELRSLATVLSANNAASLRFNVPRNAEISLSSLASKPEILGACFFDPDGELFAEYSPGEIPPPMPETPLTEGHTFTTKHLMLVHHVYHDGDFIGTFHIASSLSPLYQQLGYSTYTMILVVMACCLLAILLSMRFLRVISAPLNSLIDTATEVSDTDNYGLRAEKYEDDEMGRFTDKFNHMLEQVQKREEAVQAARDELEKQMQEARTEQKELDRAREMERELREKLSRSERMESLGQLAGGVAHDLNNILGPVVAYPEMILERLKQEDPIAADVRQIRDSASRASAIIQDLLTLGRRGNYALDKVDLNGLIKNYLRSPDFTRLSDSMKTVYVETHMHEELMPIRASYHHLEKVLMNFTINAFEAMPNGGTLTIETYNRSVGNLISGYEEVPAGDYVVLSVSDTGSGIARRNVTRIFEPFFTRKQMGRSGSGLGLAVVYGVVKDLGGYVDVMSSVGRGTQFTVFLVPDSSVEAETVIHEAPRGGTERILVVDDIEEQRDLAVRVLTAFGYEADSVDSGQEALTYLGANPVDLVVLDMILGDGMDGLETFREYIRRVPDGRCVLVSGYTETDRIKETLKLGAGAFVHKPYSRDDLARAVRDTLDH